MATEQIINRAVAGRVADRLLIGVLEVVDVEQFASTGGCGKARQQRLLLRYGDVLALASAARLRLEGFDAALVIGHMGAVDRAERNPHRRGNGRLHQALFAQQYHADALALQLGYFPVQCRFQLPNLLLAAFDHLTICSPESDGHTESHYSHQDSAPAYRKLADSIRSGSGMSKHCLLPGKFGLSGRGSA